MMQTLSGDLEIYIDDLISSAGTNPHRDSYLSGTIMALRTIIETEFLQETD